MFGPVNAVVLLSSLLVGDVRHFETKIRPVLIEQCYSCHSAAAGKQRGGLRLDTREAALKGGDSGPALVPGRPEKSLLIEALRYRGDLKMPPKNKLADAVIADFEAWIKSGADDPRVEVVGKSKVKSPTVEDGRSFWSFQVPKKPAVPTVKQKDWARSDLDAFILAELEAKG